MSYTNGLDKPDDYFNTKLWTGNATDNTSITGINFQPDLVWGKWRGGNGDHYWYDSVRGATKDLRSNSTNAENTDANSLKSFDSDGFTLGTSDKLNGSTRTMVAWNWLAGGTASSNTDGSITSTVSANTTAGFSIVSYTGTGSAATIGHGLGVAPSLIIIKNRDEIQAWIVGITSSVFNWSTDYLRLNLTSEKRTDGGGTIFSSAPTSSLINVGSNTATNGSGDNMIAYCFAEKKGYSKFGSYTGNGSSDGSYIHLGFKASYFLLKSSSNAESWHIYDNQRANAYNPHETYAPTANASSAEATASSYGIDFVSNGVKLRGSGSGINGSGYTYIYMAFAESPFTTSTGIPTTAR
jgi:hypothetical protein